MQNQSIGRQQNNQICEIDLGGKQRHVTGRQARREQAAVSNERTTLRLLLLRPTAAATSFDFIGEI